MISRKIVSVVLLFAMVTISCKEKTHQQEVTNKSSQETLEKEKMDDSTIVEKDNASNKTETFQYVCFTNDNDKTKRIWVEFSENGKANRLKYEGQSESIDLKFTKENMNTDGAHPTIENYYQEIYNGEVNGEYIITHSGNWDYVKYIRGKDGKEFNFTIDHTANPYGSKPCF